MCQLVLLKNNKLPLQLPLDPISQLILFFRLISLFDLSSSNPSVIHITKTASRVYQSHALTHIKQSIHPTTNVLLYLSYSPEEDSKQLVMTYGILTSLVIPS